MELELQNGGKLFVYEIEGSLIRFAIVYGTDAVIDNRITTREAKLLIEQLQKHITDIESKPSTKYWR